MLDNLKIQINTTSEQLNLEALEFIAVNLGFIQAAYNRDNISDKNFEFEKGSYVWKPKRPLYSDDHTVITAKCNGKVMYFKIQGGDYTGQ